MAPKEIPPAQDPALAPRELASMVDPRHALVTLAGKMDWQAASAQFGPLYVPGRGRPAISIRLVVGLHYLKHAFNLSDEQVVMHWAENPYWVRRETGKEQVVKVHYDEGIATHIGPEPCACSREGAREASAGVHVGQPLSHEMVLFPDADVLQYAEGNTYERDNASARRSGVVVEPGMHVSALRGNREISRSTCRCTEQVRIGKARSRRR